MKGDTFFKAHNCTGNDPRVFYIVIPTDNDTPIPVCRYNSFMDWYDHRNMVYLDLWCNGIMVDLEQPLAAAVYYFKPEFIQFLEYVDTNGVVTAAAANSKFKQAHVDAAVKFLNNGLLPEDMLKYLYDTVEYYIYDVLPHSPVGLG